MSTIEAPRWLRSSSDLAWRFLVVAGAVLVVGALLWRLRLVLLPVFVALLVCAALAPLVVMLEDRGWRPLLATATVLIAALLVLAGLVTVIVRPTLAESGAIADAVADGLADIEDWLVEGPVGLDRAAVERFTSEPGPHLAELMESSSPAVVSGVRTAGEVLAGIILAIVLSVLFLKDGRRFQRWSLAHIPSRHHDLTRTLAGRAWAALSGYLRGAAALGFVEGVIVAVTLWLLGSPLYGPVAVLTFIAAFFPVVGAIVAGVVATLVALASGGLADAVIMGAVAIAVQQLDNDLLAPVIYGRSLRLHAAVIVLALTAGAVLGGIAGAFLAVPLTGAAAGIASALWERHGRSWAGERPATEAA